MSCIGRVMRPEGNKMSCHFPWYIFNENSFTYIFIRRDAALYSFRMKGKCKGVAFLGWFSQLHTKMLGADRLDKNKRDFECQNVIESKPNSYNFKIDTNLIYIQTIIQQALHKPDGCILKFSTHQTCTFQLNRSVWKRILKKELEFFSFPISYPTKACGFFATMRAMKHSSDTLCAGFEPKGGFFPHTMIFPDFFSRCFQTEARGWTYFKVRSDHARGETKQKSPVLKLQGW